jgi:putative flippase GtrA
VLNNLWTFKSRKTKNTLKIKWLIFNIVSFGGLAIGVLVVKLLHNIYGDGVWTFGPIKLAYYNLYFFATVPPVMVWNFVMNHFITWKKDGSD